MKSLITILVPTRNREQILMRTIANLVKLIGDRKDIEILISDNSDNELSCLEFKKPYIRIVRSVQRLETAEENLFFALSHVKSEFTWPLGDDDVVLDNGFKALVEFCKENDYDAASFNCRNVSENYFPIGYSRIITESQKIELSYRNYLERMGYWSFPAGISLTVFRTRLITPEIMKAVSNLESKIYGHVTLYALALSNASFIFHNCDLVLYKTNVYDIEHSTTDHWSKYSSRHQLSDRFFWVAGFIKHLQLLEKHQAINENHLAISLDIGHFGHRLPLLEHLISMLLEQMLNDMSGKSVVEMTVEEAVGVQRYLLEKEPKLAGLHDLLSEFILVLRNPDSEKKEFTKQILLFQARFNEANRKFPFMRFYEGFICGNFVYKLPLGWLALPATLQKSDDNSFIPSGLIEAICGISIPEVNISGLTREELYKSLQTKNIQRPSTDYFNISMLPEIYKNSMNGHAENFLRLTWSRLPYKFRNYVKQKLR